MSALKSYFKLAGKNEEKVAIVFGVSPEHCDSAVRHLWRAHPEIPIWLFSIEAPYPETSACCEQVLVESDSTALFIEAQKSLWPRWVVLGVATWTGEHGCWPLKLAPFLIPPFRVLLMNEHRGFFAGTPRAILRHLSRRLRDAIHSGWSRVKDVSRGLFLFCFAWLAQWFSWLSRWAFRKAHGSAALVIGNAESSGSGVLVFRHPHRHWDRTELERQAHSSAARYILVLEGSADWAVDDLLRLFADDRTFAISRQVNYRDWKPMLFATAPFRQLQAGEASQTLAPVSDAILVDRAKLLALGIPDTIVPGAAWLILFWKAAAAGWRCYSVGGTRELREAPDWPYEEAEFVTRVLSDPGLKCLGPREADLSRGNVAFAARCSLADSFPRSLTVLVVSPYLPYPLSHGGAVRIHNLCRSLSDRVNFILACFREKGDEIHYEKLHEIFAEVYVVDRDERPIQDPTLPKQVREHASSSMRALISDLCRQKQIDLMQVEFAHLAQFRDAAPDVPAILVEHDLTFGLYQQLAERAEHQRWHAFERHWFSHYDAVWTMSEEDRCAAIGEGSPAARTFVVPNGVDIARFVPGSEPSMESEILYVGSFRHLPNVLGFQKLRYEIMPGIWRRHPNARLRVVAGPDHQRYCRDFQLDSRIVVHGFVEDLRPLYAQASVVVIPLQVSAGTNIKVLEAMACQKAIVTTPVGCVGLGLRDGQEALIRDNPKEFADAVGELLDDRSFRLQLAVRARRTVESRFSWTAIADRAYESYRQLYRAATVRERSFH